MNRWVSVCSVQELIPFVGVAALVEGEQIALFRLRSEFELYAISNYDPFSKAYVLSRGIVGDKQGVPKIASPIYKHTFNLKTGECLDDPRVKLPVYPVRVVDGMVQIVQISID